METQEINSDVVSLPKFQTLVVDGLRFAWSRRDIWWWTLVMALVGLALCMVPVVSIIFIFTNVEAHGLSALVWALCALSVVSVIASIWVFTMVGGAMIYVSTVAERATFWDGWSWTKNHFWAYVWVLTLVMLTVMGGLALLLIPAVIMGLYLTFAYQVLMFEGVYGKAALVRSIQLVHGRWWSVFGRLMGAWVVGFIAITCITLVIQIVGELILAFFSAAVTASGIIVLSILTELISMLLNLFISIYVLHVMGNLFRTLQSVPVVPMGNFLPRLNTVFAWLGLVVLLVFPFIISAVVTAVALEGLSDDFDFEAELEVMIEEQTRGY